MNEVYLLRPPYQEFTRMGDPAHLEGSGPGRGSLIAFRPDSGSALAGIGETIATLQRRFATAPVILWADRIAPPESLVLASRARTLGVCGFVAQPTPDPMLLRRQITDTSDLPRRITRWLGQRGFELPADVRELIVRLARYAPEYPTLAELAADKGPADWHWRRTFRRGGIDHPGAWFQVMRMVRIAVEMQQEPHMTVARLAERYGFYDATALSRRCDEVLGARPQAIRRWLGWPWLLLPALRRNGISVPAS